MSSADVEIDSDVNKEDSSRIHTDVVRRFSGACRDDAAFADCLSMLIYYGYYRRFFEPIKSCWVEHKTLAEYITCQEPFQGLDTTVALAGARVKMSPKAADAYQELRDLLKKESAINLDKEIKAAGLATDDELTQPVPMQTVGKGAAGPGRSRKTADNVSRLSFGNSRTYVVAKLKREAKKADGIEPLFVEPEVAKAADLLPRVLAQEISANAAALQMGWRKPPDPVQQMRRLWDAASEEQRAEFGSYITPVERPKWKRPKPPEFPLFMDSSDDHPVGSPEWSGRISIQAYHRFHQLDKDMRPLVKVLSAAIPGKPWLAWPKDKPWGTIDVWSELMFGGPWSAVLALVDEINPDAARELRQASR